MLSALAASSPVPGVSDPLYNCTYRESKIKLLIKVNGREVGVCGKKDGYNIVNPPSNFKTAPRLEPLGLGASKKYYTIILI